MEYSYTPTVPPTPNIQQKPNVTCSERDTTIQISCNEDGIPAADYYIWCVDEERVTFEDPPYGVVTATSHANFSCNANQTVRFRCIYEGTVEITDVAPPPPPQGPATDDATPESTGETSSETGSGEQNKATNYNGTILLITVSYIIFILRLFCL
jgi:hypothetical protein